MVRRLVKYNTRVEGEVAKWEGRSNSEDNEGESKDNLLLNWTGRTSRSLDGWRGQRERERGGRERDLGNENKHHQSRSSIVAQLP